MKQFFKWVLATLVALIIFWIISLLIIGGIIGQSVKKSTETEKVAISKNAILELDFETPIEDRPSNDFINFSPIDFSDKIEGNYGLYPIIEAIEKAAEDDHIRGILLKSDPLQIGFSNLSTLVNALEAFKESGKFIIAQNRFVSQKAYAVSTVADEIYLHPEGLIDFKGFSSQSLYFKDMLDRLGIEPMIFYAGKFKSATEPFRRRNMSEENRLQTKEFLNDLYTNYLNIIAKNRSKSVEELRSIANNMEAYNVEDALKLGLIDGLKYDDEVLDILKEKLGLNEEEDLDFVSLFDYSNHSGIDGDGTNAGTNRIAVIYAEGNIVGGNEDESGNIQGDYYAKLIRKIRKNDKIKAVVLRVNSPGGSSFASDLIWRELELLKKEKPLIVSMGNLAASGGYYISTNADKIFATNNTITGSIGVFSVLFNTNTFLDRKLGITTDQVSTGDYSDFPNVTEPWDDKEKQIMQNMVNDIYGDFIGKVADGRGLNVEQVQEIAQGRVWSGQDAIEIGLVDEIGDLNDAIEYAKEVAEVDNPKISIYPRVKSEWEQIQDMFNLEAKANTLFMKKLGAIGPAWEQLNSIKAYEEPQLLYEQQINLN